MKILVKELIPSQPYIGRPEQLPGMVKSILEGAIREGHKIVLLKTPRGTYVYDGHAWCTAMLRASRQCGRDHLVPDEYALHELGEEPCTVTLTILGEPTLYDWDGNGQLTKQATGTGFNLYTEEKVRDENGRRYYRPKTLKTLGELEEKYAA